jgi:hypothetical protein
MWLNRLAKLMTLVAIVELVALAASAGLGIHDWLQSYRGQRALRLLAGSE